jgi:poly(hydroxyalkanoate) depolymerase family esterase
MLRAFYTKLKATLVGRTKRRHRPVHAGHGGACDVEHVFKKRRYRGSRDREYLVHLPPAYGRRRKLPVVMILHGCDQDHHAIRHVSNFDRVADEHGIIVVYPFVTSYDAPRGKNCWAFWSRSENRAGAGEVEDLWQILRSVRARYKADANRLHVAGLSSGAGMAIALLVSRCNKIASGASIAGLAYNESPMSIGFRRPVYQSTDRVVAAMAEEMGRKKRLIPLMIVHAKRDRVVSVREAAKVCDSWARSFSVDTSKPSWSESGITKGTAWEHRRYPREGGSSAIETLLLNHRGHGWYGGRNGKYGFVNAPDVSARIWQFFEANALSSASRVGGLFGRARSKRVA